MHKPLTIISIEDDDIDQEFLKRLLRNQEAKFSLRLAETAEEGLEILKEVVKPEEHFLVLLDINLPMMSGLDLLAEIRNSPNLKHSIVFILTSSEDPRDRFIAYQSNIAGYILKSDLGKTPKAFLDLMEQYSSLIRFAPGEP